MKIAVNTPENLKASVNENEVSLSWNATEQMMMNAMETRIKDYEQVWLSNDNYQLTPDFLMTRICFMKLIRTRALVRLDIDI